MKLKRVEKTIADGKVRLTAWIDSKKKGDDLEVWFEFDEKWASFVVEHADPFLPILIVPCEVWGEDLEIIPPVSNQLYHQLDTAQSIQTSWFPPLQRVKVTANELVDRKREKEGVTAGFFSAGADSFYTFLKNQKETDPFRPRMTHLVMMHGYENPLDIDTAGKAKRAILKNVAEDFGLEYIAGAANFRSFFDVEWGLHYHGAGLGAAALALSGGVNTMYIASSFNWKDLFPWGTHPLLDPCWENGTIRLIHDGCEARRVDKIVYSLEADPRYLQYVHVCLSKRDDTMNCGGCYKCIRTLTVISIMGKLDEAVNFKRKFYPGYIKNFTSKRLKKHYNLLKGERHCAAENYELSVKMGHPDPQAKEFLEYFLKKADRSLMLQDIKAMLASGKKR